MTADLYDGSDKGDKVDTTSTAIGKKFQAGSTKSPASLQDGEKLDALASWPMAISYYDVGGDKKASVRPYSWLPILQRCLDQAHDRLRRFAIKGDLTELEFLGAGQMPGWASRQALTRRRATFSVSARGCPRVWMKNRRPRSVSMRHSFA